MKKFFPIVVSLSLFLGIGSLALAADKPSLAMELKSEKKAVKEGEEALFALKIKNTGKTRFSVPIERIMSYETSPDAGVTVMKEENGKSAKALDAFLNKNAVSSKGEGELLEPGQYFIFEFPLAFAEGEYAVIFEMKRFSPFTSDMQSNPVHIRVEK